MKLMIENAIFLYFIFIKVLENENEDISESNR